MVGVTFVGSAGLTGFCPGFGVEIGGGGGLPGRIGSGFVGLLGFICGADVPPELGDSLRSACPLFFGLLVECFRCAGFEGVALDWPGSELDCGTGTANIREAENKKRTVRRMSVRHATPKNSLPLLQKGGGITSALPKRDDWRNW